MLIILPEIGMDCGKGKGAEKINMAIIIDDTCRVFTLQTQNSTYQDRKSTRLNSSHMA